MALRLANKTMTTQRIVSGVYTTHLTGVPLRYEGVVDIDNARYLHINKERERLLGATMMVDTIDLRVADRCVMSDGKTFVVAGVNALSGPRFDHLEVLMREVNSVYHISATLKTPKSTQTNKDTIFKEWVDSKDYTGTTLYVLRDEILKLGEHGEFASLKEAGKLEEAKFIVTFELPIDLTTNMKIVFSDDTSEYYLLELYDYPFQKQAIVKKVLPSGKQFTP